MKKSKKIFITLCGIATTAILPVATISCNDDKLAEKNGKEKADAALKQANALAEELKKNPDYSKILETLNKEIAEATKSFKEAGSYGDYPAIISKLSAAVENAKNEQQKVDQANKKIADENQKIKEGAKELLKLSEKIQSFADTIALTITKLEGKKFQIDETFKKQLISTIELLNKKSVEVKTFATVNTIKKSELESFKEFNTSWLEKIVSEWEEVKKAWSKELAEIKADDDKKLAEENQKIQNGIAELSKLSKENSDLAKTIEETIAKLEKKFQIPKDFKEKLTSTIKLLNKKANEINTFVSTVSKKTEFVLEELESFKELNTLQFNEIKTEWAKVQEAWKNELAEINGVEELKKLSHEIFEFSNSVKKTISELEKKFKIDDQNNNEEVKKFKNELENFADQLLHKSRQIDEFATVTSAQEDFSLSELESFKSLNTTWFNEMKSEWARVQDAWKDQLKEISAK
ncbi:variable adherence-associated lipoprotein adhesin Vaa [Metamycoplasma hominis]|uniref:variable adherence-associated lipoprotein adhesin Vaa n=1 Tax=Metamycoplasma hominis TaxID=2098 RepID=UPI00159417D1|nr:variable adherence-associated lipoprotein adhesin Vaa [Metamycoplasma hominis]QKX37295.1 variable adherence-associated lipoprotein adhesin Vaa [Metamycoplasma hominis]